MWIEFLLDATQMSAYFMLVTMMLGVTSASMLTSFKQQAFLQKQHEIGAFRTHDNVLKLRDAMTDSPLHEQLRWIILLLQRRGEDDDDAHQSSFETKIYNTKEDQHETSLCTHSTLMDDSNGHFARSFSRVRNAKWHGPNFSRHEWIF